MQYFIIVLALLNFLFFLWFTLVSISEKEAKASKRSAFLAIALPLIILTFLLLTFHFQAILAALTGFVVLLLLLPIKGKTTTLKETPSSSFDERDTMFSRLELTRRPELQKQYYSQNPDKEILDADWQKKPGLMSENASLFSPLSFKAANASFFPIEQLRAFVNGEVNSQKTNIAPQKASEFIKNWALSLGAVSVGICKLNSTHFYSHGGRADRYDKPIQPEHNFALAFTVEMNKEFLAMGPAGPTLMESAKQYLNSGSIALQIAKFIRELGYSARAHVDGNYEIICPTVARDAGLGEIGRMGLLMTPELGPRVRIAVVSTSLPLIVSKRKPDYSVQQFCSICKKCARICPSQAVPKSNITEINGVHKWQVNHEKCFSYWCTTGTDCGRCMSVCSYSHPNNLLHNLVRWGIKNNAIFRQLALIMDDFFYGKNPKPKSIPEWMEL